MYIVFGVCTPSKQATFQGLARIQTTNQCPTMTNSALGTVCSLTVMPARVSSTVSRKLPGNRVEASVGPGQPARHIYSLFYSVCSQTAQTWLAWRAGVLGYLHRAQHIRQTPKKFPGNFPEVSGRAWRGRSEGRGRVHTEGRGGCSGSRKACCGLGSPCQVVDGGFGCVHPIWPRV